ncbi:MAG: flippase [Candidatus Omnitrophota bacterium]|nr:flippase [Candidatus Omnitrophota bacterium]
MERLEKNFIWMGTANIVGSFFSVALFIYLARTLKAEAFGSISYAHSFIFYMLNFVDLGLSTYGIREIAKNRSRASEYVSEIVSFKLLLASALFVIVVVSTFMASGSAHFRILMIEVALLLFVAALSCDWAFQGLEKMHMVFVSFAATTMMQFLLVYFFVKGPDGLLKSALIYSLVAFLIPVLFLIYFRYRPKLKTSYLKQIKVYLSSSIIIWSIAIFAQVYNGFDIVLLGLFKSPEEVGFFTIARRAIGGAILLIVFLANALLPRLSSTFLAKDLKQFKSATHKFLKISLFLAIFVVIPLILFSNDIISFMLGDEYLPAGPPLKIMAVALIFVLFNLPHSTGLIAAGFEKAVSKQVLASAVISVVLNLVLMPRYGMVGASISYLVAEAVAITWILWVYNRHVGVKPMEYLRR